MTSLDILFMVSGATLLTALLFGRLRLAEPLMVMLYAAQLWALIRTNTLFGDPVASSWQITVLVDQSMSWRYNSVSWFFAMLAIGAGLVSALYAAGAWMEKYLESGNSGHAVHLALAASVFSMVLLLGAADFLTLFLGLELVGWSGFLFMAIAGGVAAKAALKYLAYAFSGAMAILGAMALIYANVGSLEYGRVIDALPSMTSGQGWALLLLMGSGFAVKMGLLPFHLWQAQAYAETPAPGAVFLGAVFARMGFYDFIAVFISMVGIAQLAQLEVPNTGISSRELLAWLAAFTIILPTYTALKQQDARYLLTWLGVGQGGYMLLGLMVGDAGGTAGGLLHVFSFAITQAALLMAVFAVMYRTGTSDLNMMGGLARRMPWSFAVVLLGFFSLAGLPPMAGFVSKWLIYRSLASEGMPLLLVASVIGTVGTILAGYRLIYSMFLGRLRIEQEGVREAPPSMLAPMLAVAGVLLMVGFLPSPILNWVAAIQAQLGLPVVDYYPGGFSDPRGDLNMIWIVSVLLAGLGLAALAVFGIRVRSKRVHAPGSLTGGHFPDAETRHGYVDSFYAGLMQLIGPWYCDPFAWLERALVSGVRFVSSSVNRLYRYVQPTVFLLATAVAVVAWAINAGGF